MLAFARSRWAGALAAFVSMVVIVIGSNTELKTASAAPKLKFTDIERFQCVVEVGPAQTTADSPFTPAVYRTVINLYNPQDAAVQFTKTAVVARSERSPRGLISAAHADTLQPGEAIGIDCVDIQTLLGGPQPIGNGVIVIRASDDLKVIPAYTQLVPPLSS